MINQERDIFSWSAIFKTALLSAVLLIVLTNHNAISSTGAVTAEGNQATDFTVTEQTVALPAKAFLIFDVKTGEVLASNNSNAVLPMASVTKIFTASTIIKNMALVATTSITASDVETEGKAGKLKTGEEYTYQELLFPLLLESSNDAAAVFERLTKGDVVAQMNTLVTEAGAENTSFADASGLSKNNVTTATDLAKLTSYLSENYPQVFDITILSKYVGPYTGWMNNNPVVAEANYLGGKHGYTEAAGKTIVSLFAENFSNEERVIGYVILGSNDLRSDVKTLRKFVAESVKFQ